jgi:tetratricopeptide (TPR) repeat protein
MGSSAVEIEQLLQAARLHLAKSELQQAVERATEAIRLETKQSTAYLVRAEAHRRLKRPDRALADLAVAIRLDPNQPGPYVIRAEILKRRNMFDQAIADASHAIILDARSAAAYSIRAECRSAIGDTEGADEDVQEMLLIDPTRPVPDLRAKSMSGDPNPAMELADERFWKQSGGKASSDTTVFADGKPVDKTYRSRRVVSDDEAPEALGVASGYKPGTIGTPIPRLRMTRTGAQLSPILAGIVCLGLLGGGYVLINQNRNPHYEKSSKTATQLSPTEVAKTTITQAEPNPSTSSTPATHTAGPQILSPGRMPAVVNTSAKRLGPKLDLLRSLDPERDSAGPRWEAIEGGLVSPEGGSVLKIRYHPPEEYRLTLRLLKGSKQMVGIGLMTAPSQVLIVMDSFPDSGCFSKFAVVDGRGIGFHEGSRVLPMFEMSTVVCTVRKGSITVEANGRQIGRWDGDFGRLAVHPEWAYGGKGLFIGSVGKGTVIRGLEIEPIAREINAAGHPSVEVVVATTGDVAPIRLTTKPLTSVGGRSNGKDCIVKDLGSFRLDDDGRSWGVVMPENFTKAEVIFYRGDPSDQTLNAAWEGRLQINGKDVVRFQKGSGRGVFLFHDFTTATDYAEKNDYKKTTPNRYLDVTNYLRPGYNAFFYYHQQRADLPMGVILRISEDPEATDSNSNERPPH